jgi:hypothetical protein
MRPAKDGRTRLQHPGGLVSSPFLARCQAESQQDRLLAQIVDEALGTDRGEVVWGNRSFGTGGMYGGSDLFKTSADYGGRFIFRKDGAERGVTEDDADATLRALKTGLERELKKCGMHVLKEDVSMNGMRMTGFLLSYEDPGMPAAGDFEASITLPAGDRVTDRLAVLSLWVHETSRKDRVPVRK